MTKFVLTIGIPGSGKTTFAKKYAAENKYDYISSDEIRYDRFADEFGDSEEQSEIWREARLRIAQSLKSGKSVLLDSTMTREQNRTSLINFAKSIDENIEITGMHFNTALETCLERNSKREKPVPEEVIEKMFKQYQPPSETEGFTEILELDENFNPAEEITNEFNPPIS
ncbi:ATP-binding protein [Candidatus Parcubacteria bacterium]|nr:ATP-binding protein [Candidatus Parcubacteria bacterium]